MSVITVKPDVDLFWLAQIFPSALTAACACVSPSGREWKRNLLLCIAPESGSFSLGKKAKDEGSSTVA